MTMNNDDFDRKSRQLYEDAAHDTPQVIRQRLHSALSAPRPSRQAWQPALAFASLALFAVGALWLQRPLEPASPATVASAPALASAVVAPVETTPAVAAPAHSAKETARLATAAYDNDPEFYAWLGNTAPPVPGEE